MNAIILMGTEIGDNTIIGAGSVVSGKLQGDSFYAGNPTKRICSIDDYYIKLKNSLLKVLKYMQKSVHLLVN